MKWQKTERVKLLRYKDMERRERGRNDGKNEGRKEERKEGILSYSKKEVPNSPSPLLQSLLYFL